MSTPISNFIEPIRFLLGDHDDDADARLYEDAAYLRGLRVAINSGMLPGFTMVGSDQVTPDVTTQAHYAILSAKVAYHFASSVPSRRRIRTRAWSEEIGDFKELTLALEKLVFDLENGNLFSGWQSYAGFLEGYRGLTDKWAWMTRLTLDAPWATVTFP